MRTSTSRPARGTPAAQSEQGIALVVALMAMMLLTALGMALMLTTTTETMIAANYRDGIEGMYAADAGIERTMQDLLTVPDWNNVIKTDDGVQSHLMSGFTADLMAPAMGDGRTLDLAKATAAVNCPQVSPTPASCTDGQMDASTAERPWGVNNPRWRLYAHGPVSDFLPSDTINSPFYVAVWVADDPSENDGNPALDGTSAANPGSGVIQLRAEAFGPGGAHRVIEVTLARTDNTEIERGYTGQRGQDEQNRRARKAAVQTPGTALTRTAMSIAAGGLQ